MSLAVRAGADGRAVLDALRPLMASAWLTPQRGAGVARSVSGMEHVS